MAKVTTQTEGNVWIITINRPEVRNCVDGETAELLGQAWRKFRDDSDLYVAIITGAGEQAFCAGADLKNIATLGPKIEEKEQFIATGQGYLGYTRQTDIFKPIIAAIHGYALAGGLEIACLADIRIADANAQFGVACRRYNVPLVDGGTQRLPRIVGMGQAMELIITGRFIDAQEALRIGLANEVVPAGQALTRAKQLAQQICLLPQEALRADKQAAMQGYGQPLAQGLRLEAEIGGAVAGSMAMHQGIAKFLQRKPQQHKPISGQDHIGVGCGALIEDEQGRFLLLHRRQNTAEVRTTSGMWSVPGGEVEFGEKAEDAILREVKEELGVDIEVIRMIGISDQILDDGKIHWHCVHFLCKIVDGIPRIAEPEKFTALEWFSAEQIPENSGVTHVIRPLYLLGLIDEAEYQRRLQQTRES